MAVTAANEGTKSAQRRLSPTAAALSAAVGLTRSVLRFDAPANPAKAAAWRGCAAWGSAADALVLVFEVLDRFAGVHVEDGLADGVPVAALEVEHPRRVAE